MDAEGMEILRRGKAPTIRHGPYTGDKLSMNHIIPRSVSPELNPTLANLELMPLAMNREKISAAGQHQRDLGERFFKAGLLSKTGLDALASK